MSWNMNAVFCVLFLGMLSLSKAISATESPTGCVSSFAGGNTCSPDDVVLHDFPQWQQTEGYWIGELTYEDALNKLACVLNTNSSCQLYCHLIRAN